MYNAKNLGLMPRGFGGLMEEMFSNGWNSLLQEESKNRMNVPVNVKETEKAYELQVIAPGLKKEDFKINLEKSVLSVSFEQKSEHTEQSEGKWIRNEYSFRSFKRSFTLSDKIDTAGISAAYTDGVLQISLPKKENVAPDTQEISVK